MNSPRRAVVLLVLLAASAAAAPAPAPGVSRAELESLQTSVEAAVARVSRPAGLMFGRPSRAYHLKGYGAVVVLAPRALPRLRRHAAGGPEARALADVLVRLERSIEDVRDPGARRRLEEALVALRDGLPPGRPLRMPAPRPLLAMPPRDIQSLQEQAEAFRRKGERAMEQAEREVRIRLLAPEDAIPALPPEAPLPPIAAEPPLPVVAPVAPLPPAPAVPPVPPVPEAPEPPGWPFSFGEDVGEDIRPDRILADVRRAIVAGLGAYRGALALLGPDDSVVVVVDFVPGIAERRGSRTVVARARKRDLADHRAGRLSAEALQARVEFDEY